MWTFKGRILVRLIPFQLTVRVPRERERATGWFQPFVVVVDISAQQFLPERTLNSCAQMTPATKQKTQIHVRLQSTEKCQCPRIEETDRIALYVDEACCSLFSRGTILLEIPKWLVWRRRRWRRIVREKELSSDSISCGLTGRSRVLGGWWWDQEFIRILLWVQACLGRPWMTNAVHGPFP